MREGKKKQKKVDEGVDYKKMLRYFAALERALHSLNKEERDRIIKSLAIIFEVKP